MGYDVIGDLHGQGGKLEALLRALGYTRDLNGWRPPHGRQAVFVGDLIDRGPGQREVVDAVRRMVDAGRARCVMGNHEFNAIGWLAGLRPHSAKNRRQHGEFLRQVGEGSALHRELVGWFRTLPPALDLGGLRVVHAWWSPAHVALVDERLGGRPMDDGFVAVAFGEGRPERQAMEGLTKGFELDLPDGHSFVDHDGHERFTIRTKWWLDAPASWRELALLDESQRDRIPDAALDRPFRGTPVDGAPVIVGHYWLQGRPQPQSPKVACLDYSAARRGPLVGYRWDGEAEIDARHFVAAGR